MPPDRAPITPPQAGESARKADADVRCTPRIDAAARSPRWRRLRAITRRGAGAIEYAMIASLISVAVVAGAQHLGEMVGGVFDVAGGEINAAHPAARGSEPGGGSRAKGDRARRPSAGGTRDVRVEHRPSDDR